MKIFKGSHTLSTDDDGIDIGFFNILYDLHIMPSIGLFSEENKGKPKRNGFSEPSLVKFS